MKYNRTFLACVLYFNFCIYCGCKEILVRNNITQIQYSVTTEKTIKHIKRNLLYLHSIKMSRKNSGHIVSGVNIEEMKEEVKKSETLLKRNDLLLEDTIRTNNKLLDYIQFYLPKLCKYIYDKTKLDIKVETDTIALSVEKIYLLNKQNEYILVPFNISSERYISRILLGRDVIGRHRKENTLCIGKVVYKSTYFNTTNNVYQVELYNGFDDESTMNSTNLNDFSVLMDIPLIKNETNVKCAMWNESKWDLSKCKTSIKQQVVNCACKSLGYFSIVSIESNSGGSSPMLKTDTITQSPFHSTIAADKLIKNTIGYDTSYNVTVLTQKNEEEDLTTAMNIATTSVMVFLGIGIISSIAAWYVIYRRNRNAVEDNNLSYGRYFDEHTLDELPE